MNRIGKPPEIAKRREMMKAQAAAIGDHRARVRMAEEAKQRGATREEIRLIMEA